MDHLLTYRGAVYTWHCDQIGHMNVMHYTGKFDEATWNLLARIGVTPSYLRKENRGMVAVEQRVAFRRELLAGDIVEVRSFIREVREKAILFTHEMFNTETGELAAQCEFTAVHLDRETRRATAFPGAIRTMAQGFIAPIEAMTAAG